LAFGLWCLIHDSKAEDQRPDLSHVFNRTPPDRSRSGKVSRRLWLYHKYGVQEYWVVDQENQSVLLYRCTKFDEVTFKSTDRLRSDFLPGFEITIENLFKY
jgi:Uma2 family endonuclease